MGGLLPVGERAHTQRHVKHLLQDALGRGCGEMLRPRTPRGDRLHPRADSPSWDARRHRGPGRIATYRAGQAVQRICRHPRLHRWPLGDLLSVRLRIFPTPRVLATGAPRGLDRDPHSHCLHRSQGPGLPLVAGLPTRAAPTGLAARPFPGGLLRIARPGPRGGARGLRQLLGQVPDGGLQGLAHGLQHRDSRVEGTEVRLRLDGQTLPDLWWQRRLGVRGSTMVRRSTLTSKYFLLHPRERLRHRFRCKYTHVRRK